MIRKTWEDRGARPTPDPSGVRSWIVNAIKSFDPKNVASEHICTTCEFNTGLPLARWRQKLTQVSRFVILQVWESLWQRPMIRLLPIIIFICAFPMRPKVLTAYYYPVIGYIWMPHLHSAQFPLPREHSLPGIATYNGAGKFKHNNLSPPTGSPFIHLGREQQCG